MNPFVTLLRGGGWVCQHGFPDSVVVITPNDQENLGSNAVQSNYSFENVLKS